MPANTPRGYTYATADDANDIPLITQRLAEQIDADVQALATPGDQRVWQVAVGTSEEIIAVVGETTVRTLTINDLPAGEYVIHGDIAAYHGSATQAGYARIRVNGTSVYQRRNDVLGGAGFRQHHPARHVQAAKGDVTITLTIEAITGVGGWVYQPRGCDLLLERAR